MKPTVIKTKEEMIFTGHHWLVTHAKRLQDELIAYRAAAESIFTSIEHELQAYDDPYEAPPTFMTDAYGALFELLDKAPPPENPDPSGGDLPY